MKFDRKCRQRLLSPSSGINVFVVLPVVLQILTAQGAAAPSIGSSAILTIQKPRNQVQASGFGDRNGVLKIAQLGSYDMPVGPGYSNGAGGAALRRNSIQWSHVRGPLSRERAGDRGERDGTSDRLAYCLRTAKL